MTTEETTPEAAEIHPDILRAYCMKTKEKNVPVLNAILKLNKKGAVMVSGNDAAGNKLNAICNRAKAEAAVAAGLATWAEGAS